MALRRAQEHSLPELQGVQLDVGLDGPRENIAQQKRRGVGAQRGGDRQRAPQVRGEGDWGSSERAGEMLLKRRGTNSSTSLADS